MTDGMFTHRGGNLYFQTEGNGEPIVFIHGFSLDHTMWKPQVDYFSKRFLTVTYDMRGFGQSSVPTEAYSHHEDLCSLLHFLHIDRAHIVGLSLGGEMAINFALTYPEKTKTLTLIDSSLGGYPSSVDWDVHAKEAGVEEAKRNWIAHRVFAYSAKNPVVAATLTRIVDNYSGWHWINHDPREVITPLSVSRLKDIIQPTLVLVGEYDLDYYHGIAKRLSSDIPNAKLHVVRDSGHMSNLEQPDTVNSILDGFIAGYNP